MPKKTASNLTTTPLEPWYYIFNQYQDLVVLISEDDRFIFANDAWLTLTGRSRADLDKLTFNASLAPECRFGCRRLINEIRQGRSHVKMTVVLIDTSDEHVKFEASFSVIDNLSAQTGAMIGILNNSSHKFQQVESTDILSTQIKFYQDLINDIPDIIFFKNSQGIYQECNLAMIEFLSKTKDLIIGETDVNVFSSEAAVIIKHRETSLRQAGSQVVYQLKLLRGDHQLRDFLVHEAVVKSVSGEIVGFAGIMIDVHDELVSRIDTEQKLNELFKINKLLVGRELKMIELKSQIKKQELLLKKYAQDKSQK